MISLKTNAIILKRQNYGESDRLLTLFSDSLGKITAIAKGSRKYKSKLLGCLEPFNQNEFCLTKGRSFYIINETSPVSCLDITETEKIKTFHILAEIVLKLLPEEEPNIKIYKMLKQSFLENNLESKLVEAYFITHLISELGIQPELSKCVCCQTALNDEAFFSIGAGGMVTKECLNKFPDVRPIGKDTVIFWRVLTTLDFERLQSLKYKKDALLSLTSLLEEYYVQNLGTIIKSRGVFTDC